MGEISAGKTSLLNTILGLKNPTSIGHQTKYVSLVFETSAVQIFDSPGNNKDFAFYDIKTLNLLHQMDKVLLLYSNSLLSVKNILLVLKQIKPNSTYLIRTQCDLFSDKDSSTLDQELANDKAYLKDEIKHNFPIYASSARKGLDFRNNLTIKKMLEGAI